MMEPKFLKRITPFLFLCFFSCGFFDYYENLPVVTCSSSYQYTIVDTLTDVKGKVSFIDVVIDDIPVQKWVILPDKPLDAIYEPCNLPYQAREKTQRVIFSAYVVYKAPSLQDTLMTGTTGIELTKLETIN